jgi:hypothetical protein
MAFLTGIACWAVAKTRIGSWGMRAHENKPGDSVFIFGFVEPLKPILSAIEVVACIIGILLGLMFLISVAA